MFTVSAPAGNEVEFDEQPFASVIVTSAFCVPEEVGAALLTCSDGD
jgi:hypothetical protein